MSTQIKYRPTTLDEFVFADDKLKSKVEQYASGKCLTPLVLHGPHGTGKSLLTTLIPKAIEGRLPEVTRITAEDLNTSKEIREKLTRPEVFDRLFGPSMQSRSYTVIEEVNFNAKAKGAFRVALDDMAEREQLIITTNELDRMDSGLKSRAELVEVLPVPPDRFLLRAKEILLNEGIEINDLELLAVLFAVHNENPDNRGYYKALDAIIYKANLLKCQKN